MLKHWVEKPFDDIKISDKVLLSFGVKTVTDKRDDGTHYILVCGSDIVRKHKSNFTDVQQERK